MREHLVRLLRRGLEAHGREADEQDRQQEQLEGGVEHDGAPDDALAARGEGLLEEVRPEGEAGGHDEDRAAVAEPRPALARLGGVAREPEKLRIDRLEHLPHAAVQGARQVQPEGPGHDHHEEALQGVGPADPHDAAVPHVEEHHAVDHRGADLQVMPRRYGGLCLPVQEGMVVKL